MKQVKEKLKKFAMRARGRFPSKLPTGMEEFDKWSTSIFYAYDLPDDPTYKNAVATMVLHLQPDTRTAAPKKLFAANIKRAQANQIAYIQTQLIREASKAAQQKAAMPPEELAVDDPKQSV